MIFLWIGTDDAVAINAVNCASTREPHQLIDPGKLEGALARPENAAFYDGEQDILHLAIITLVAIARAHAFLQGNKRTAFHCARLFLQRHGYDFDQRLDEVIGASGEPVVAEMIIAVIEGEKEALELEVFLEAFIVETEQPLADGQ
ncbi:death-on-curing family protein [Rhizobium sp. SG_E_25_P2]|nr:death-on-curing family protein [Rhizobium sp. SG_E_25_P2]